MLWTLIIGSGFLFYLTMYPPLFFGVLVLAGGVPSLILYKREKREMENSQNVSVERRENALNWFIEEVKPKIVENQTS